MEQLLQLVKEEKKEEILRFLIDNPDFDVNASDEYHTLLNNVAMKCNLDMFKFVAELPNIDINRHSKLSVSVAYVLFVNSKYEHLEYLFKRQDFKTNAIIDGMSRTALIYSCDHGRLDLVKILLGKQDIDINIENNDGYDALNMACYCKRLSIVQYFLENGVNTRTKRLYPLLSAYRGGAWSVCEYLLSKKCFYDSKDFDDWFIKEYGLSS